MQTPGTTDIPHSAADAPAPAENAVSFVVTEPALLALWGTWILSPSGVAEQKVQRARTIRKYLLIIAAGLFTLYAGFRLWALGEGAVGIVLSGGAIVVCHISLTILARRHEPPSAQRWLEFYRRAGQLDDLLGPVTYTALSGGLQVASPTSTTLYAWTSIRAVRRGDDMVVIEFKRTHNAIIPRSAFESEHRMTSWINICESARKAAPDPLADPLAEHLKGNDFNCRSCGYNLRDATRGTCPECGWVIRINP